MLRDFEEIYALAAARKGGVAALEEILAETPTVDASAVARLTDDRVLSRMTRRIFAAGFSYQTIDRKWPAFETAFRGFDPRACAAMSEAHFDALMADRNFTRNGPKVQAVMRNARFLLDLAAEHGSAAKFFAAWPDTDFISLVAIVRKRGSYMGGETAMRFIRALGKPAFVNSPGHGRSPHPRGRARQPVGQPARPRHGAGGVERMGRKLGPRSDRDQPRSLHERRGNAAARPAEAPLEFGETATLPLEIDPGA